MNGNKIYEPHTCSLGNMNASTAVLLSCLALMIFGFWGFVFCCVVIGIERKSGFVKFSVTQAALVWAVFAVVVGILSILNGTFSLLGYWLTGYRGGLMGTLISLVNIIRFVLLIILAAKGLKWEEMRLPVLANIADTISRTGTPVQYDGTGPVPPECRIGVPQNPGAPGQNGGWQQPPQGQPYNPAQNQPYQGQPPQPGQSAQTYTPAQPQAPVQPQAPQAPQQPQTGTPYKDPNQQLPPEMRDSAPPKDMH